MSQYLWQTGDLISATRLNSNSYNLFKGVAGFEDTITLADNAAGTFLIKPTIDPAITTQLFQVQNAAGTLMFAIQADGTFRSAGSPAVIRFDQSILAAPAASVTLTPVAGHPATHLRIVGYAATDEPAVSGLLFLGIRFNFDSTATNYDAGFTVATSGAVTAISEASRPEMLVGYLPAIADLANGFGTYVFDIPYYTNTANKKILTGQWGYKSGNATDFLGVEQGQCTGTWNQTAAITSVTLFEATSSFNFVAGTIWTLLGVP